MFVQNDRKKIGSDFVKRIEKKQEREREMEEKSKRENTNYAVENGSTKS